MGPSAGRHSRSASESGPPRRDADDGEGDHPRRATHNRDPPLRRHHVLLTALLATACGGGPPQPERPVARGFAFPHGFPQPQTARVTPAFPDLELDQPIDLAMAPDDGDHWVVAQRDGLVLRFANREDVGKAEVFLDLRALVFDDGAETGLLAIEFAPDFAATRSFFTMYTRERDALELVVSRWKATPQGTAVRNGTEQVLLGIEQPSDVRNGGGLTFGADGMLYIGLGDGGDDPQTAQDLTTLLGKVLRVAPNGSAPSDNPFVGDDNARPEIWAYGFANPWRLSFDAGDGTLFAADVGGERREEIDVVERGRNYGWPIYEADLWLDNDDRVVPGAMRLPLHSYERIKGTAIIGGFAYRGTRMPTLAGHYIYADHTSGNLWALIHRDGQAVANTQIGRVERPVSFGVDHRGEVLVCSLDDRIYRLEPAVLIEVAETLPETLSATKLFRDLGSLTPARGLIEYRPRVEQDLGDAVARRWFALPERSRIEFDATGSWRFPIGTIAVQHLDIPGKRPPSDRLETRILVHQHDGWHGYSYRWNRTGTEAFLEQDPSTELLGVDSQGGNYDTAWHYPGNHQCSDCHNPAAGAVLGLSTAQLNRPAADPESPANPLDTWNQWGLFDDDIGSTRDLAVLIHPEDDTAPLGARAQTYLAVNCSSCHRPGGMTEVDLDFRLGAATATMRAVNVPCTGAHRKPGLFRLVPGNTQSSEIWRRMRVTDRTRMPPAGNPPSPAGIQLIRRWIEEGARLPADPPR